MKNKEELEQCIALLKKAKFRVTEQRKILLDKLLSANKPLSAEELFECCRKRKLDLVTIYRNMNSFVEAGVAQRIPLENGKMLFEIKLNDENYPHLICRKCHKSEVIAYSINSLDEAAYAKGFSQLSHTLEIYGTCSECNDSKG